MSDAYPGQPLVFLDTNAVRNLFRPRDLPAEWLQRFRAEILARVEGHSLRIVATQPLIWELTSIIDDAEYGGMGAYEEAITFVANAASKWWMKHEWERKRRELRLRRPLRNTEAFAEFEPSAFVAQCLDAERIATYQRLNREEKARERNREAGLRQEVVDELQRRVGDGWRDELRESIENHWVESIRRNTRVEMRRQARRERMTIRGPQWPLPERAPTFWFGESFWLSKVRHVFLNERADLTSRTSVRNTPDLVDSTHFRDAAYVHILVTNDANFTAVASGARTNLVIMTLVDFAAGLGLAPPR